MIRDRRSFYKGLLVVSVSSAAGQVLAVAADWFAALVGWGRDWLPVFVGLAGALAVTLLAVRGRALYRWLFGR